MSLQVSVVVPMFNEEDCLPLLVARLRPVLDALDQTYEVLVVDDGSIDLTPALLEGARRTWPSLRVLRLRMNAGHQAALSAGLMAARGDHVVCMDADLQDPPELVPMMLETAHSLDVDVVYGIRSDRSSDTWFKRSSAALFYRVIARLSGPQTQRQSGDFRLMSRALVDAVNALPPSGRVIRFVVPALGFPSAHVHYRREPRAAGNPKYRLRDMIQLSLDSITGVSMAPLRIATYTGLVGGVLAFLVGITSVLTHFAGHTLPGWTSTVAIVSAFGALQLLCLGVLGEYIGRTYAVVQNRPVYVVAYDSVSDQPGTAGAEPRLSAATSIEEPNGRS